MKRLLSGLLMGLAGCAQLPHDLPPRPALKTPEVAATLQTLAHASAQHDDTPAPSGHWWQTFGLADLDRLIDTALKDAPDLGAVQARLRMADQAERLARLDAQVHYETDATMVREHLSRNGLFPPPIGGSTFTQTNLTQNLSYNLDWWGRNRALVQAAGNERQAAQDEAAAVRLGVASAVADAYFAGADVEARLQVARALEQVHRREHALLKVRFDLGLDAAQPLIDARKKLDLDEDRIRGLEYQARSLRYRLSALIGADPDHAGDLPAPALEARLPPLPDRLPMDWLARRPDVAALRSRVEAAADQSAAARADFYPNLDLRMMVGLETLDLGKLFQANSLSASIGPALHLPIFNGQTLRAKLGLREADYAAAVAAYNRTILDAARQAADTYALIASLEQRSQAQRLALQETEQTRGLARQRQTLGLANPLDALEADSAVLGQRMNDIEIQAARLRARVALFKALGGDATLKDPAP
ncbi:MAG: efflux transporter outer membrane subunit [Hydrogenophilales bacterium]|nr:efflux transporter outer membrane subunit [Hydrogenophilales bacterium]